MSEGLFISLAIITITIFAIGLSKIFYARCRDCGVKIYQHTIHKCPVSGKRYKGM